MSYINLLTKKGLISPPKWLPDQVMYETAMGSLAYGVTQEDSDFDIYGFCIPPKEVVFPHLDGEILGFGRQKKRFNQYQQHHIFDSNSGKTYDITIFNIVDYFRLLMDNNPNIIDSLFTSTTCVLHCTQVGNLVRENRKIFLHKGAFHRFKGYAYSQLHKMSTKETEGKRKEIRDKFGFDVKYAMHLVRLLNECEQILTVGDINLQQNNEQLKAIRRGEVSEAEIRAWFSEKERFLEKLYSDSPLPYEPNENKIKSLLLQCLKIHYGDLTNYYHEPNSAALALKEISTIIEKYEENNGKDNSRTF
jgi:predicted nucleotidyltransferase